jgi:hypothetical protein
MYKNLLFNCLFQPSKVFKEIARTGSPAVSNIFRYSILLVLLPPFFAWFGASNFGWRLGAVEPLYFDSTLRISISLFYSLALCFGFVGTVLISRWMAITYGARTSLSLHFAFITVVTSPLVLASIAHLYPNVLFNVLVFIPAMIWCMNLLYRGLPIVLGISPERGMLMASALVGWMLVAAVSLLGISVGLWTMGIGPGIAI